MLTQIPSRDELRVILREQYDRQLARRDPTTVTRTKLDLVPAVMEPPYPVVVTGLRRAGKSVFMRQIAEQVGVERGFYLDFEDERLAGLRAVDLALLHEVLIELFGKRDIFYLDEVQNVDGWETWVRRVSDDGIKFIISGSNAKMLSRELGSKLTGRNIPVEIFPFSFQEFLAFNGDSHLADAAALTSARRAQLYAAFDRYLREGGIPDALKFPQLNFRDLLYKDILHRDIIARHRATPAVVRVLGEHLLNNTATLLSATPLLPLLSVKNVTTANRYIDYFEESWLFLRIALYARSVKQAQRNPRKVYAIDTGLARSLSIPGKTMHGALIETACFLALRRRYSDIFYFKTRSGKEIDFFLPRERLFVQSCADLRAPGTEARELGALEEALREHADCEAIVVAAAEQRDVDVAGRKVPVRPLPELLTTLSGRYPGF